MIEKSFDVFENKLMETKTSANSENAKTVHAAFLCLAANLLTLLDKHLSHDHGVEDTAGRKRQQQRMEQQREQAVKRSARVGILLTEVVRSLIRGVKLIRWVRADWSSSAPLVLLVGDLRASDANV